MTRNFPYTDNYALLMMRKSFYNQDFSSFVEMATRQSKDKYARLRSMKNEPLSSLVLDAKRHKFGKGKFEGPALLALFQVPVSPTLSSKVVAALSSSTVASPITHSKGKGKVEKSVWEDRATAIG